MKFLLKIPYNNELLERLKGNPKLRAICGFDDGVPSESALSRFATRLANHQDLLKQCLTRATNSLRGLLPTRRRKTGKPDQELPPLGKVTAIDSTLFPSYSNPNRKTIKDPDARWGVKHSARAKEGGTEYGWGYKMHLISDATHDLPLDFVVTPANQNDSVMLPGVIREARASHPWLRPRFLLADRGYDALSNHKALVCQGIIPVIHMRKPTRGDLHDGIYATDGSPTCIGKVGMEYVRTDPATGHHLLRCRSEGCHLKDKGNGAMRHCDSEVWERPADNLRVIGVIPRSGKLWKHLYKKRMSIERIFRSLKHSRGLEKHCARGMKKILLQATMSVLTFQATALARVKAQDSDRMRQMAVKVA